MLNLNKEVVTGEDIELILEEMRAREEFHCTGYKGCPINGCSIDNADIFT